MDRNHGHGDMVLDTSGLSLHTPGLDEALREAGYNPDALTIDQATTIVESLGAIDVSVTLTGEQWTILAAALRVARPLILGAGFAPILSDVDPIAAIIDQVAGDAVNGQDPDATVARVLAALASRS